MVEATALSIYLTQIPIAVAIFYAAILMNGIKNILFDILKKQIEINEKLQKNIELLTNDKKDNQHS